MKDSIRHELAEYIYSSLEDYTYMDDEGEDYVIDRLITEMFHNDYYLIGYHNCEVWLKDHNLTTFEAINLCRQVEEEELGTFTPHDNSEALVNSLVAFYGTSLMWSEMEEIYVHWRDAKKQKRDKAREKRWKRKK